MRSFAVLSLAALTAVANAIPHAVNHRHVFASLAGRSIMDGKCSATDGNCEPGYCCSQYGYCGKTSDYCGTGCNPAYGTCGSPESSSSSSSPSSTVAQYSSVAPQSKDHPLTTSIFTQIYTTTMTRTSSSATVYSTPSAAPASSSAPVSTYAPASSSAPVSSSAPASSTSYAPAPTSTSTGSNSYKLYTGDGTTGAGWPSQDSWVDFDSMWSANMKLISISCTQFNQPNNSDQESEDVKSAIQAIAASSGIDPRFILAIMMQESKGCVRAPTTNYGVRNPGLMQSHDGTGTCNDASVQNPCPSSAITQMIKDGATGTAAGDGLEQTIAEAQCSDVSKYYKAARIYNSGSIAAGGNLGQGIATHCYSSDIANRLTGWVDAATTCNLD